MKVLILIAVLVFGYMVLNSARSPESTPAPLAAAKAAEPAGKVELVSLTCQALTSHTKIEGTIRNTGATSIKHPSVFVRFSDGTVADTYTLPMTLPPGSLGEVNGNGPNLNVERGTIVPCEVIAIQDGRGNALL